MSLPLCGLVRRAWVLESLKSRMGLIFTTENGGDKMLFRIG